jgi:transmembrane sensor
MDTKKAQQLLHKYKHGKLTSDEKKVLDGWYLQLSRDENTDHSVVGLETKKDRILERLTKDISPQITTIRLLTRIAAAASIMIGLSIGAYIFLLKKSEVYQIAQKQTYDITPGHNQATLTLANGKKIIITQNLSGNLAQQGNMLVQVTGNHAIAYLSNRQLPTKTVTYNTMSTGIGEQSPYPLVLADGTQILLDANSSVSFPVTFKGADRMVKVSGKAWFKVAPIANHPFYVDAGGQITKEIGTEFIVNAYDDDSFVRTTLVEGSIEVIKGSQHKFVLPGQQALTSQGNSIISLKEADTEEAKAWINGYFQFNNEKITEVMKQLARWYKIDVSYQGKISEEGFNGKVSRNKNLSVVLRVLQETNGVHFKIKGKEITVIK